MNKFLMITPIAAIMMACGAEEETVTTEPKEEKVEEAAEDQV